MFIQNMEAETPLHVTDCKLTVNWREVIFLLKHDTHYIEPQSLTHATEMTRLEA